MHLPVTDTDRQAQADSLGYTQLHDQPSGTKATTARPSVSDSHDSITAGTPDHLQTNTDLTEHSEDTIYTAEEENLEGITAEEENFEGDIAEEENPEGNFAVVSSSVDDFDRPDAESQAHKQAISSNFRHEGASAAAPAVLQSKPSVAPSMAPTISSQNLTAASAPSPDTFL